MLCPVWGGVDFDNTDDVIGFGAGNGSGTALMPLTISIWIKPRSRPAGTNPDWKDVILWKSSDLINGSYGLSHNSSGTISFRIRSSTSTNYTVTSTSSSPLNEWTHVAAVADNTAHEIYIYFNGIKEATLATANEITNTQALELGRLNAPGFYYQFDGVMTEFALWNIALSDAEILQLAKSKIKGIPLQTQSDTLVIYCPLDDEADGTSADGDIFMNLAGDAYDGIGVDGANNTGLTATAEAVLSYPWSTWTVITPTASAPAPSGRTYIANAFM